MRIRLACAAILGTLAMACRGEPPSQRSDLRHLVDSLTPSVERAAGLRFRGPVQVATRTKDQLRAFLLEKADEAFTPERLRGMEHTYRLLGLLPDTLALRDFLVALLTEQVAGFYDPKTETLYAMEGQERTQLVLILAHEMVHALQHQYLPLDSILAPSADDDRQLAAQAILEGQATLASVQAMLPPGTEIPAELWQQSRDMLAQSQTRMPIFARAPLVIREQLIFPYLSGADFMLWWSHSPHADTVPYGPRMPQSSEQILAPDRYARDDAPLSLMFADSDPALFENTLGELDLRILQSAESGGTTLPVTPTGWGGDRYRVYETPEGPALVWYIAWDDARARDRFHQGAGAGLAARSRPNYRSDLARVDVDGTPASRLVIAPQHWNRWADLPPVRISRPAASP